MLKSQIEAVKKGIKNPRITLNEKVLDGIKNLNLDQEVVLTLTGKVYEISRETYYDYNMEIEVGYKKERPKILKADFEIIKAEVK